MNRHYIALALAPLALAACTQQRPAERPAVSPAARVTGEGESCIPIHMIRESRVRDDWTIDFMRDGKRAWRNTLPQRCSGLRAADAFGYSTSLSQLCSTDIIWVLEQTGGPRRGASCGLGKFVPVELETR